MKILYISYDGLLDSISQSQILPYLYALAKRDFEFVLFSFEKREKVKNNDVHLLKEKLAKKGICWVWRYYHKSPAILATIYDISIGIFSCIGLVIKRKIGIIHARSYVSASIALVIKSTLKRKFIFDMRGFWPDEKVDGGSWKKNSFIYKFVKYWENIFINYADALVVLTSNMKRELESNKKMKVNTEISVIPTCVDLARFATEKKEKVSGQAKTFVYLGSVGTVYMLNEMLDFFKVVKQRFSNTKLLILTNNDAKIVTNKVRSLGAEQDTINIRQVPHEEVPQILRLAQIGIAFYRPSFSSMGRSPTKLGEYLACGLIPVVNSGIGDCNDLLLKEGVGVIVEGFSTSEYGKAIDKLQSLLDEDDIALRCRNVAEKYFSLETGIETYHQIYRRFLIKERR